MVLNLQQSLGTGQYKRTLFRYEWFEYESDYENNNPKYETLIEIYCEYGGKQQLWRNVYYIEMHLAISEVTFEMCFDQ